MRLINISEMSVKRSQNFLYFQNKAQHYHNIQTARPRIETRLSASLSHTIDHTSHNNRDLPYNKQHQIDFQNKHLAQRILEISQRGRKEVEVQGAYSRFHKFQRDFRRRNPYREEEERMISLENEKIHKHIQASKPQVGTSGQWQAEYRDKHNYRRLRSRYDESNRSRGDLQIEKEPFLPDPYLRFIERIQPASSQQSPRASSSRPKHVRIEQEKLFILPTLTQNTDLFPQRNSSQLPPPSIHDSNNPSQK